MSAAAVATRPWAAKPASRRAAQPVRCLDRPTTWRANNVPARCSARAATEGAASAAAASEAAAAFAGLAAATLDCCAVQLQPCGGQQGNGLVLTAPAAAGQAVLRVPLHACLVVDYAAGMRLPAGQWPRLQRGIAKDDSLPWDILQALALLDSLAGGGDALWQQYSAEVLPQPLQLTLPLCFPPDLLPELQHGAIMSGAQAQQERLAALFPGLSASMCQGGPSWLQWGFACVRSRAFKLRDDCFAFVPFLDVANHAADPSCDFRLSADGGCVELVALKELPAGAEATISYTGPGGQTNQRLMAQYGFVQQGGNTADRLVFAALQAARGDAGGGQLAPAQLSLDRMQAAMGDGQRMAAAMGGQDAYAYAALKSLPFVAEESGAAELSAQLALAQQLAAELAAEADSWPTSMDHDGALLAAAAAGGSSGTDARLAAAVNYRLQRKALVATCRRLLADFAAA